MHSATKGLVEQTTFDDDAAVNDEIFVSKALNPANNVREDFKQTVQNCKSFTKNSRPNF